MLLLVREQMELRGKWMMIYNDHYKGTNRRRPCWTPKHMLPAWEMVQWGFMSSWNEYLLPLACRPTFWWDGSRVLLCTINEITLHAPVNNFSDIPLPISSGNDITTYGGRVPCKLMLKQCMRIQVGFFFSSMLGHLFINVVIKLVRNEFQYACKMDIPSRQEFAKDLAVMHN